MSQEAVNQFRAWIAEQGLDAFLVTQPQNRSYLSGWLNDDTEGSGFLLVSQQEQIILTNTLYKEVAAKEAVGWEVTTPASHEYAPAIVTTAQQHGWKKIGFESMALLFGVYEKICSGGEGIFTLVPFEHSYVDKLRQVKQPYELELLKRAIAITDETFTHICQWIQPGMTEKEVQWEITRYMVALGADGLHLSRLLPLAPMARCPMPIPAIGVSSVAS